MTRLWIRNRRCSYPGCEARHFCKGYCRVHYGRWKRTGDPNKTVKAPDGAPLQFATEAAHFASDECLIYPYGRDSNGYANIWVNGECTRVHVLVCELAHGPAPKYKPFALHTCGSGQNGCVNPGHLYWGTQKSNMADAIASGTTTRGIKNPMSKLTLKQVYSIRLHLDRGESQERVAEKFGVSQPTVSDIAQRRTWAWLK